MFGKRIVVARPREQAAELIVRIESMGAEAIEAPMLRIEPPEDYAPLDAACREVARFDFIVFSSANAVDSFMERLLASPLDLRELKGVKLCAVGPVTAERLTRHGLKIDVTPAELRAQALVDAISEAANMRGLRCARSCGTTIGNIGPPRRSCLARRFAQITDAALKDQVAHRPGDRARARSTRSRARRATDVAREECRDFPPPR